MAVQAMGANALAMTAVADALPVSRPAKCIAFDTAATVDSFPVRTPAAQPSLFTADSGLRIVPTAKTPALQPRTPAVRRAPLDDTQATLDFLPPLKAAARTLKTDAEAVIYCDAAVAAPIHRFTAATLDGSMILLAFGVFLGIFQSLASPVSIDRNGLLLLGASFAMVAFFYGLLFAISGTVTPGMRWTNLRMISFDGFAPDPRARAVRLAGCWMSFLSGGLGLAWSLLDEEGLTWHDHISKTFPTIQESTSNVVRR